MRRVITVRGVRAGERAAGLETWPWTAKIRSRDGISIEGPVQASGARKARKKQLELLALLIEAGPTGARLESLADQLWPESEGDHAQHALETTVYRLRMLLDDHNGLVQSEGFLKINPARVFVEAWTSRGDRFPNRNQSLHR